MAPQFVAHIFAWMQSGVLDHCNGNYVCAQNLGSGSIIYRSIFSFRLRIIFTGLIRPKFGDRARLNSLTQVSTMTMSIYVLLNLLISKQLPTLYVIILFVYSYILKFK